MPFTLFTWLVVLSSTLFVLDVREYDETKQDRVFGTTNTIETDMSYNITTNLFHPNAGLYELMIVLLIFPVILFLACATWVFLAENMYLN